MDWLTLGGLVSWEVARYIIKALCDGLKSNYKPLLKRLKALKRVAVKIVSRPPTHVVNNNLIVVNHSDFKSPAEFKKFLLSLTGDDSMPASRRVKVLGVKGNRLLKFINSQKGKESISSVLRPHIPPADLRALEASLLMREYFKAHKDGVEDIKADIIERFGDRGRRIANLCTAGYFENLVSLCKENCDTPEGQAKFKSIYEMIISQEAFAVFVTGSMSEDQTEYAVVKKTASNMIYGKKYVDIHGIGTSNVKKINTVLKRLSKDSGFSKVKETEIFHESKSLVFIRLKF